MPIIFEFQRFFPSKMKYAILLSVLICLSCMPENKICSCIKAGDEVNMLSASLLNRDYSVLAKDSLSELIHKRDSLCLDFQEMSGEQMLELKKDCVE